MKRSFIIQHFARSALVFILPAALSFLLAASVVLPQASPELQICRLVIQDFDENYQPLAVEFRYTIGHRTLLLMRTAGNAHVYGWDNLVVGIWDERFHRPVGTGFASIGDGGQWENQSENDKFLKLTLSNETLDFGECYTSGAYLVEFDGTALKSRCIIPPTSFRVDSES